MLRDDLSSRFDYLFEPLEVDESAGEGHDAKLRTLAEPDDDNRWSRRIVQTGVVLATLAAAAASADQTSTAAPTVRARPPPVQPPSTVADEPPSTMPPPTTTRAPISVSPETRAPFPNQTPPGKNKQGGGLLGGLL
jgi:hypothetical protein